MVHTKRREQGSGVITLLIHAGCGHPSHDNSGSGPCLAAMAALSAAEGGRGGPGGKGHSWWLTVAGSLITAVRECRVLHMVSGS